MTDSTLPFANIHSVFPTSIVHIENALPEGICNRILSYILRFKVNEAFNHGSLDGPSISNHTSDSDIIKELDREINYGIYEILNDYQSRYRVHYGLKPGVIKNSWFNIQDPGSVLKRHVHPNSEVSCALFINIDKDSSPLVFHTPNPYTLNNTYERDTEYTTDNYSFLPKIGDVIVFPSWLAHSSNHISNQTHKRCVISYNS
jgi:uncharacterized protein (TIGR02466 family)